MIKKAISSTEILAFRIEIPLERVDGSRFLFNFCSPNAITVIPVRMLNQSALDSIITAFHYRYSFEINELQKVTKP